MFPDYVKDWLSEPGRMLVVERRNQSTVYRLVQTREVRLFYEFSVLDLVQEYASLNVFEKPFKHAVRSIEAGYTRSAEQSE